MQNLCLDGISDIDNDFKGMVPNILHLNMVRDGKTETRNINNVQLFILNKVFSFMPIKGS